MEGTGKHQGSCPLLTGRRGERPTGRPPPAPARREQLPRGEGEERHGQAGPGLGAFCQGEGRGEPRTKARHGRATRGQRESRGRGRPLGPERLRSEAPQRPDVSETDAQGQRHAHAGPGKATPPRPEAV